MICFWSGVQSSERRRSRLDRSPRGPDRPYSLSLIKQGFNGYRKSGIHALLIGKRVKRKLRVKSLPVDAVACRTRFFRPWSYFSWSWRPFSPICARLRIIWAKPPELEDYSGRMRALIARRFWTVEFGRVSVRNSPFEFFPRNLRSVSRNSHSWILRALWFTFPRVKSSNVISVLSYLRFCDNFLGSCISYLWSWLAISPREWLCSFSAKEILCREFCVKLLSLC